MIVLHRFASLLLAAFALTFAAGARAQLTIEIIGGGGTAIPIAIVPFAGEATYPYPLTEIVAADLNRSGLFRLVDPSGVNPRPARAEDVRAGDWTARGADAVVVGNITPQSEGRVEVRFFLVDAVKSTQLAGLSYVVAPSQFRATAHQIADVIYEKLTGDRGVFSTRIAYITKQGPRYELVVADADGYNPQSIVTSNEPLLSPSWSPDGTRIAYVSLENRKPVIYIQSLTTGKRQLLANFRGSNSAPNWSPDGRRLAVTLSLDGGSHIFLINPDGSGAQRIMTAPGIDTEPNFSPDGKSILFTSDRGGSPQIYRYTLASGTVERMTFDGNYNVSPRHLPDGKGFVFVRQDGRRFNLAIEDFATRQVQVLTQGDLDESPSIAPNGKLILYASENGGRGILAAVSSDGRVKQRLTAAASDVREPAWGPLTK
ncbi:MAG TPA: Tol-Pal system beta propeller repeat protein TolB [Casimicrobiaceae bacterium]|nr:Tol-Pal system beta propeller repeat protein TolB [Casimicrobiaceae bacterium]